jgi:acyl carrier protein
MREQIKEVMKQVFKMEHIKDTITQKNCDKWDSLNHLNLIIALEQRFNISIEPVDIVKMTSLDQIENLIISKCRFPLTS